MSAHVLSGALVVALAACAPRSPAPAPSAETNAPAQATTPSTPIASPARAPAPPAAEPASPASAPSAALPVDPSCVVGRKAGGASLDEIVNARRCKAAREKWIQPYDPSALSFAPDPASLSVQRGDHGELYVQIEAKTDKDALLQLELSCRDEAILTAVYDAKGKRVDESGPEPDRVCEAEVLQVLVRAGDSTSLRVPFIARRYAWHRGEDSRRDLGPLPAGNFELRLSLPVESSNKPIELKLPLEVTR